MSRLNSNCKTRLVPPRVLDEVISVTPAIFPHCRSRGAATEVAMVSGSAPGSEAFTEMVGKSTAGRGATGSVRTARIPAMAMPKVSSVVATGLLMKMAERFIPVPYDRPREATLRVASCPGAMPAYRTRDR